MRDGPAHGTGLAVFEPARKHARLPVQERKLQAREVVIGPGKLLALVLVDVGKTLVVCLGPLELGLAPPKLIEGGTSLAHPAPCVICSGAQLGQVLGCGGQPLRRSPCLREPRLDKANGILSGLGSALSLGVPMLEFGRARLKPGKMRKCRHAVTRHADLKFRCPDLRLGLCLGRRGVRKGRRPFAHVDQPCPRIFERPLRGARRLPRRLLT